MYQALEREKAEVESSNHRHKTQKIREQAA
jgi:hypothetical protein